MAFNWDAYSEKKAVKSTAILAAVLTACLFFLMPRMGQAADTDVLETFSFDARWPDASVHNLAYGTDAEGEGVVYFASGNFLVILNADDLTERSRLKITVEKNSGEQAHPSLGVTGIAVDPRGYVYAGCGPQGIAVIDVSNTTAPEIEKTLAEASQDDPIYASGLDYAPDENLLYVADVYYGLRCIDVADPQTQNPFQKWGYPQTSDWTDEAYGGHINVRVKSTAQWTRAFVLDQYYGLRIFNISGSSAPDAPLASFDMRSRFYFGQYSRVVDIAVDDKEHAYVTDLDYGVTVLDYSGIPETEITNVGQIETPGNASGLGLSGDKATLLVADGSRGLLAAELKTELYDPDQLSYPKELVKAECYGAEGAYAVLPINQAEKAFLASGKDGLAGLDKTGDIATGNLAYVKNQGYDPPADTTSVYADEEYAYILDNDEAAEGLRTVILKDDETGRPGLKGFVATPGSAHAAAVHGSFAYVADGAQGVAVINITDKTAPSIESTFTGPGNARAIRILQSEGQPAYAYIADSDHGLVIAEVDETTGGLTETGDWAIAGARAVAAYEQTVGEGENEETYKYAAVVDGQWLRIVDVTDPNNPDEKGGLETGDCRDVAAKNLYGTQYAIVADGANGIRLVDISDPLNPELIDTYAEEEFTAEAVSLHASYIHAAVGERGILVLGISDLDPPELTPIDLDAKDEVNPYYNTPGYASDVFIAERGENRYSYVADTHGGFLSLEHEDTLSSGINEQPFTESPDDSRRIECFISSLF
ncbi:MAG: hypothetical protein K9K82_11895 [Desulfobacteraceae bacterium]|nr:hypothetical protein [Desulfobacteraceae bacterium]